MHKFANVKTPVWLSFSAPQTHKHMATSHNTSGLQVHLTKHGGTIARRMLTFIHNSFPCLPPPRPPSVDVIQERCVVWLNRALRWKPQTLTRSLGLNGHLLIAPLGDTGGLFTSPFLLPHLVNTCSKCI